MWTAELKSARLVTIYIAPPFGIEDIPPFLAGIVKLLSEAPGHIVTCMDLRASALLAPEAADMLIGLMRRDNPHIERTAMVLSDNALVSLQVARMIREAGNPNRRAFHDAGQAATWLSEVLSPAELQTLRKFLHLS